ncbi:hypothetical protein GCM10011506_07540 [Marivirga lumbricoides]|uniref:N-acetyltransferase domain-containing protein n=1 Tax=Marivirga lumbricoides TaxID=1046115 RepID=A0ABQ1LMG5_9BACT|nr:hypothetical protein GCM10011506_07540 [Marivirga lumbricoides]
MKENKLPYEDLLSSQVLFITRKSGEKLIACIGIEKYGSEALLRSFAVDDSFKNKGIGAELLHELLTKCEEEGVKTLHLLTTTAAEYFYKTEWYEKLNLVEFCFEDEGKQLHEVCNDFLKREFSAYRFVDGIIVEVNSKEEIIEIEEALNQSDKFKPVKTHLSTALRLLADKKSPDYRNSIKESISAVESISKIIVADNSTTLGQALKEIEKRHKIPKSLKSAFSTLYGYTSDVGGIRHALLDGDDEVKLEEAKFMLVACSAFINYLITKI